MRSAFGVEHLSKAGDAELRRRAALTDAANRAADAAEAAPARHTVKERFAQAKHPPPVKLRRVTSTAVHSLGYQQPTRRLAVAMHSRPDEPYLYRVPRKTAHRVLNADSKGRAYTSQIRGKAPHATRYTVGDRVRMFASPQ